MIDQSLRIINDSRMNPESFLSGTIFNSGILSGKSTMNLIEGTFLTKMYADKKINKC